MSDVLLQVSGIAKRYHPDQPLLTDISFTLVAQRSYALFGVSGSGKSTLLNLIAGLQKPDSGSISYRQKTMDAFSETSWSAFRLAHVGFVFQHHHLIRELTVAQNIMLPPQLAGVGEGGSDRLAYLLQRTGLSDKKNHYPHMLSGGERQRVAIARALSNNPSLVIADEPTGNLDWNQRSKIAALLCQVVADDQRTLLVATHDRIFAKQVSSCLTLENGTLIL